MTRKYNSIHFVLTLMVLTHSNWALSSDLNHSFGAWGGAAVSAGIINQGSSSLPYKGRLGLNLGAYTEFPLTRVLNFRPEISLVQKGFTTPSGAKIVFDYLEIPFLLVPKFFYRWGSLYFPFGASYGLLIKRDAIATDNSVEQIASRDLAMGEICLQAGVGVEVGIGAGWGIFFSGRYSSGLTNVFRTGSQVANVGYTSKSFYSLLGFYYYDNEDFRKLEPEARRAKEFIEKKSASDDISWE